MVTIDRIILEVLIIGIVLFFIGFCVAVYKYNVEKAMNAELDRINTDLQDLFLGSGSTKDPTDYTKFYSKGDDK